MSQPARDLTGSDLAAAVAYAGWSALLPPHRTAGEDVPVGTPVLLDALPLGPGWWLAVVGDERSRAYPVPLLDAAGVDPRVRRAEVGEGAAEALLTLLAQGNGEAGRFLIRSEQAHELRGEVPVTVDQTNESVVVGGQAMVKWTFHAEPGPKRRRRS